jgi:hypothetical protein
MASECRAKNPAKCRNHGNGYSFSPPNPDPASVEAGKKEFFGSSIWNQVAMMQERSKTSGVVRSAMKKAFQDIRGFDRTYPNVSENTRKYIVETLMNRELATIKRDGDPSEAAALIRERLAPYENTSDDGASALATVKLFKALGRDDEVTSGMEDKAYRHAQKPAKGASFEAHAEAMVHVLNKHKVFGDTLRGKYLASEMRGFKGMVRDQATGKDSHNSLELTYRGSNVRLLVDARVVDNEVMITKFKAYDHPAKNPYMDYENLNKDLTAIWFDED